MGIGLTLKLLTRSEVSRRSWDEVDIKIAKQFGTFFCQRVFSELISQQEGEDSMYFVSRRLEVLVAVPGGRAGSSETEGISNVSKEEMLGLLMLSPRC